MVLTCDNSSKTHYKNMIIFYDDDKESIKVVHIIIFAIWCLKYPILTSSLVASSKYVGKLKHVMGFYFSKFLKNRSLNTQHSCTKKTLYETSNAHAQKMF